MLMILRQNKGSISTYGMFGGSAADEKTSPMATIAAFCSASLAALSAAALLIAALSYLQDELDSIR